MTPRLAREPAENPNVVVYHATRALTEEVIDGAGPPTVRAVPGVAKATANRYRMRVHRRPDVDWAALLEPLDAAVRAHVGAAALEPCPPGDEDYRRFPLAAPADRKRVYEGVRAAAEHRVAAALFRLDGVAEAIFEAREVTVRKGRLFAWAELEAAVRAALGGASS